jgi:zinc transport system substrate-binding protein
MAVHARPRRAGGLAALIALLTAALIAGCGGPSTQAAPTPAPAPAEQSGKPVVVAASTWEGAFAKAAGAGTVTVIVPPSIKHAPDYDPKPSDLAAVAGAKYVLYAPFEGFVGRLKEAAGTSAQLVELNLDNSPDNVRQQVRRLADLFGTRAEAERWLHGFDKQYGELSAGLKAAWPGGQPPTVVAQTFVGYAAQLAGAQVVGSYGPGPVTATQLAELSARQPRFVFDNEQMSTGTVLPGTTAKQVSLTNYPGPDLDLLSVYRTAAATITGAWRS